MDAFVLSQVLNYTATFYPWRALELLCTSQSRAHILIFKIQLQFIKKGLSSTNDYIVRIKNAENTLATARDLFDEQDLILYILIGFGFEYDPNGASFNS